jgi:hypothetical protein
LWSGALEQRGEISRGRINVIVGSGAMDKFGKVEFVRSARDAGKNVMGVQSKGSWNRTAIGRVGVIGDIVLWFGIVCHIGGIVRGKLRLCSWVA